MRKLQSSIEKFMLLAIITMVAIGVSYYLYSSFYSTASHIALKSYWIQAIFDNIYGNKTSIFILMKNKIDIGSNTLINEKITFYNGTSNTISVPFVLTTSSVSGGGFLYYFTTSSFPAITNRSQAIKISNIYAISGNTIIESENDSVSYTAYYYTKASLANLPLYYLNMTASPLNAGVLTPGSGYYYAGSKVAISEKPNTGYAFAGWLGYENGNYTGTNQTAIIEINSNVTEYAKYVKLVKMYVNATYNGIPVYINGILNTTTNGTIYFMPGAKYTLFIPRYIAFSNGTRYVFENMQDDCGISIAPNSNSTTFIPSYANYNCKFTINVVKLIRIYLNATYTGIPVYANGELIATTNEAVYLIPGTQETLSFPSYVSASNGVRYAFENIQDNCSIPIIQNSNSTTFVPSSADYNCKFIANYINQYFLSINFNSSEGSVTPSSGWYNAGSQIEISATPHNEYMFLKAIGSGTGSYTGNDSQFYVTMDSPITETIVFEPLVYVYVYSSLQSVPYSFQSTYGYNSTFYNGTTNSNFVAPAGSTLMLGSPKVNWGTRVVLSISSSSCPSFGNLVELPTTAGASCIIYIYPTNIQYLFIVNEFLNGGNRSNSLKYGTVYLNGNPMTSNQTWINAGTKVTFYATNDKAGYAFQGFIGTNGILDGVAYSGVSGTDSSPVTPVGTNQHFSYYFSEWGGSTSYSKGYNTTAEEFPNAFENGAVAPFVCDARQYIPLSITMNGPVIENAYYSTTKNITGSTVKVVVHYTYSNVTLERTVQNNYGGSSVSVYYNGATTISSGQKVITFSNITPYSNYSAGIGNETVYYLGTASLSSYGDMYSFGGTYSYQVSNFSSQQLGYMPSEYKYIINQTISDLESQYKTTPLTQYSAYCVWGYMYCVSYSYTLNLQLSFNLSGTQVYVDYDNIPTGTVSNDNSYSYSYGGSSDFSTTYYGYSNYDFGCS